MQSIYNLTDVSEEHAVLIFLSEEHSCQLLSQWFLARLFPLPWRYRRFIPPKLWSTAKDLHAVITLLSSRPWHMWIWRFHSDTLPPASWLAWLQNVTEHSLNNTKVSTITRGNTSCYIYVLVAGNRVVWQGHADVDIVIRNWKNIQNLESQVAQSQLHVSIRNGNLQIDEGYDQLLYSTLFTKWLQIISKFRFIVLFKHIRILIYMNLEIMPAGKVWRIGNFNHADESVENTELACRKSTRTAQHNKECRCYNNNTSSSSPLHILTAFIYCK